MYVWGVGVSTFLFFFAAGLGEKGGPADGGPGLAGRWAGAWRCTPRNPGGVIHSGALFSAEHYYAGRCHEPRTAPGVQAQYRSLHADSAARGSYRSSISSIEHVMPVANHSYKFSEG